MYDYPDGMVNTNLLVIQPGETSEEFDNRIISTVDANWMIVKTRLDNEMAIDHWNRFKEFQESNDWKLHINSRKFLIKESNKDFLKRKLTNKAFTKSLEDEIVNEYKEADKFFEALCVIDPDKSKSGDKFYEFDTFIKTHPYFRLIKLRRDGESELVFSNRYKKFITNYKRVIKSYENLITSEAKQLNNETIVDWKIRVQEIFLFHFNFIYTKKNRWKEFFKSKLESDKEFQVRINKFHKILTDIDIYDINESSEAQRKKDRDKEQDRILVKRKEEERLGRIESDKVNEKNYIKIFPLCISILSLVLVMFFGFGFGFGIFLCGMISYVVVVILLKKTTTVVDDSGCQTKIRTHENLNKKFSKSGSFIWTTLGWIGIITDVLGLTEFKKRRW